MTGFLAVDDACPIVLEVEERKDTIQYYVKPTREAHDGVKTNGWHLIRWNTGTCRRLGV